MTCRCMTKGILVQVWPKRQHDVNKVLDAKRTRYSHIYTREWITRQIRAIPAYLICSPPWHANLESLQTVQQQSQFQR
jgi:hypothetical protein